MKILKENFRFQNNRDLFFYFYFFFKYLKILIFLENLNKEI